MPETLQILHYEDAPDMVEKRKPHRDAHIDQIKRWHGDDRLVMAEAVGDPPYGGLLASGAAEDAEAFADEDPNVEAELVVKWWVEPWTVVT